MPSFPTKVAPVPLCVALCLGLDGVAAAPAAAAESRQGGHRVQVREGASTGPRPAASGSAAEPGGSALESDRGNLSPAWPQALYNPKPLADDLVLPLPCGGALAFRPVATPPDRGRSEVVGPFAGPGPESGPGLLIGKYEVTALQYRTVTGQAADQPCPLPGDPAADAAAQVGVSRIDALNFAAQVSRWLNTRAGEIPPCEGRARPCLPRVDGRPAFVRLPLEQEWEYAARGGAAVSDAAFAAPLYPMPEGLPRHAWYNRNADGAIAPIGLRLPSPLGLHDLYGNAWEVMNDPFRSERFPGQAGGDVLRGGGIHSDAADLRADLRVEVQPFDAAGDVKTADTGFRVVLAAPIVTSRAQRPVRAGTGVAPVSAPAPRGEAGAAAARAPPPDGVLLVEPDTPAIVLVDGEVKGAGGPGRPLRIPGVGPGARHVEARAAGYPNREVSVEVTGGAPVLVPIHMEPTPERAESLLDLNGADRLRIRRQLARLGYRDTPSEAPFGGSFRGLARAFQREVRLPPTGYLDKETLDALERMDAARREAERSGQRAAAQDPKPHRPGGLYMDAPDAPESRWMDPDVP